MKTAIAFLTAACLATFGTAQAEQHLECANRFEATVKGGCFSVCTGKLISDDTPYKFHHSEDGDGHLSYYYLRDEQLNPDKSWIHIVTRCFIYRATPINCRVGEWCRVVGNYFGGAFDIYVGSPPHQLSIEERDNWRDDGTPAWTVNEYQISRPIVLSKPWPEPKADTCEHLTTETGGAIGIWVFQNWCHP
jgi:hypothetical protein